MERLQFAIWPGAGRAAGAITGAGRCAWGVSEGTVPDQAPTRGEAEKGRRPPAKSTVIFASLLRGAFEICFQDAYILPACSEQLSGFCYAVLCWSMMSL